MSKSFVTELSDSLADLERSYSEAENQERLRKSAKRLEEHHAVHGSGVRLQLNDALDDIERAAELLRASLEGRKLSDAEETASSLFINHRDLMSDTAIMNLIQLRRESGSRNHQGAEKAWSSLSDSLNPMIELMKRVARK